MATVTSIPSPVTSQRGWFRFSLRTFLLFVAIASVWLGWMVIRARTQREAVAGIQSAGGTVLFDCHENGPRN